MKKYIILIIATILFSGCSSVQNGRFSVIDLDLRTAEQIDAGKHENTYIYQGTNSVPVESEPKVFPVEYLFKFLEIMKGRIRILSLEWKSKE